MSDLPIDYLAAGVLHSLYDSSTSNQIHSYTVARLHDFCEQAFGVQYDIKFSQAAVERLFSLGAISYLEDPFADTLIRARDSTISEFFKSRQNVGDIYWKTWEAELPWLKTAFEKSHFWQNLAESLSEESGRLVPASDRIVTISDNQPEVLEAREAAAKLVNQLKESNDLGDLTAEEANVAQLEVAHLEQMLADTSVRRSTIIEFSRRTLRWISEKAAGAAVGKAALGLLALIGKIFGL